MSGSQKNDGAPGYQDAVVEPNAFAQDADSPRSLTSSQIALLAASLIVMATVLAYDNSFRGPFIFDDTASISENATIQHLWPIWKLFCPPNLHGETVGGRPVLNFSLALNYAASGFDVWSYHVVNVAFHLLAALLLFGVVRRTFLLPALRERWSNVATPLALVVALLWAVHPLQTESVTHIVQRAEPLVGLFYLLTLYCVIRGASSPWFGGTTPSANGGAAENAVRSSSAASVRESDCRVAKLGPDSAAKARAWLWYAAAVAACTLGMASKETMVSAPLIVLLFDRAFLAGSFREAWRRRYGLYLMLAGTWLLLGWLVTSTGNRGGPAGVGIGMSGWTYLCTQLGAIVHYLWLSVWPSPLVLDYGVATAHGAMEIVPYAVLLGPLAIATCVALWRWPKAGFFGAWFFAILAPTSSVLPVATQTMAEHRMYLPLAAVVMGVVVGGYLAGRWLVDHGSVSRRTAQIAGRCLAALVVAAFVLLTFRRNTDYASAVSIWQDTVDKVPNNVRARSYFGLALADGKRLEEAVEQYRKALKLDPKSAQIHNDLGVALSRNGRVDEAIVNYRIALELDPYSDMAYSNLGDALRSRGQLVEAMDQYEKALDIRPGLEQVHNNLGVILANRGHIGEAVDHFRKAVEIKPAFGDANRNLGELLAAREQFDEAISYFDKALTIMPADGRAIEDFRRAWDDRGATWKLLVRQRQLLRAHPKDITLLNNIAWKLATNPNASIRDGMEAIRLAQRAVELSGGREPAVLGTLAAACAEADQFSDALKVARRAAELAKRQNKPALARSIQSKIRLYEASTPFREMREIALPRSTQP